MEPTRSPEIVRFGAFELDLRTRELRNEGLSTGLPEQSIKILALLLEKPGEMVLREEIRKKLWPNDTVVEFDHSINAAIKRLRQALGDSAESPQYIETLARRGYRWLAPVQREEPTPLEPPSKAVSPMETARVSQNLIGKKVSHYRVLEVLGGGGMGVVYKAEDLKLGRRVALKFLPEELASDPGALNRFESEARAASALNHPNICTIYEVEEHEGQPFLVMELLEGQTLRDLIATKATEKTSLEFKKLIKLAVQIAAGLQAAHEQGIIHRDIKPANVFVTSQGQAKILDFGLAKLFLTETMTAESSTLVRSETESTREHNPETDSLTSSSPFLSRTGVAMGTAGYMSPEQIRGEKLDARTDLFSFGLVLYEMATGHRAFAGDTAPLLHEAILKQIPTPVRELNQEIPTKIERIIQKAIEKDPEARYQSALELRTDLEALERVIHPKAPTSRWLMVGGVMAALLIVGTTLWLSRIRPPSGKSPPEPKLRQLTNNSIENPVRFGAISPNGNYLAYSDKKGIHIQVVATGETHVVPQPEEPDGKEVYWEIVGSWFPDNISFIVNSHPFGEGEDNWSSLTSSIWLVSAMGGQPHKLRDNAIALAVSPSDSLIAFAKKKDRLGEHEMWLMEPSGEHARKLFDTDKESSISGFRWAGDGKRFLYAKTDQSGDTLLSSDLTGGPSTLVFGPSEMGQMTDYFWQADGRLLYSMREPPMSTGSTCVFWEMRLDPRTGLILGKPQKLTNWSRFCATNMSETSDGKKLAFLRWSAHITSYVADLAPGGTRILQPKHFPLTDISESVADWAPDSKSVILVSNRSGNLGLYMQSLDKDTAEPLVTQGFDRDPQMSPDGKSVIYLGIGENGPSPAKGPQPVMSVPITGGPSQQLFIASSDSLLTCARSPSKLCAIGEATKDGEQLTISAVDPMKGRGPELFRIALNSNEGLWRIAVSHDGARFAVLPHREGPIYIYSPQGELLQQVQVKGRNNLDSVVWAADEKSLFATANTRDGSVVLNVDLHGNAHTLWEYPGGGGETLVHPSPDGRLLEFNTWTNNSNIWLMESF